MEFCLKVNKQPNLLAEQGLRGPAIFFMAPFVGKSQIKKRHKVDKRQVQ
jgi:hypothetical protein